MSESTAVSLRPTFRRQDFTLLGALLGVAALFAAAAAGLNQPRLQSFVGLAVILAIAFTLSANKRAIDWRTVGWGLVLQIVFAPHRPQDLRGAADI